MLNKPLFAAVSVAVLLTGCATSAPDSWDMKNARTYPDSRDVVWQRILATSAAKSMYVTRAEKDNGLIFAEREIVGPGAGGTVFDWADCGWGGVFERALSQRVELNYVVRSQAHGATVSINSRFKELRQNMASRDVHWVTCTSTGQLERQLLQAFYFD